MQLKKTGLVWVSGILFIIIGLYYAIFGNFNINNILYGLKYEYTQEDILKSALENGYEIDENLLVSQKPNSSFSVKLPRKIHIDQLEINFSEIEEKQIQIYLGQTDEYGSDSYFEIVPKAGENAIVDAEDVYVKYLNFYMDGIHAFQVRSIVVKATEENRLLYFIFCPFFILIYCVITSVILNRSILIEKVSQNKKWREIFEMIDQILSLAWSDFKGRFSGSYLGILWGIFQPLSTILLFWFVFQVGFRSNPIEDVPFILWLSAGMIPWNFFYDSWMGGTSAFVSYSYIVKKVVFKIEMLPLVKAFSSFILNLVFNGILIIIYCIYGRFMGLHIFDMVYFSLCLFALSLGLSYITATLNVFVKDIGQLMGIILQVLMWMTPMMWDYHMIPEKYSFFYKLNPLHYILNGYRESLISGHWFFEHWVQMIWFWAITAFCLFFGRRLMCRLKDHFADVL